MMESVLKPNENTFTPYKNVEFDKNFKGEVEYLYQKEEQNLQEELFKMYEEMEDEKDEYDSEEDPADEPHSEK